MSNDEIISRLAAASWPSTLPAGAGRGRASWVVRTERVLAADLPTLAAQIQAAAREVVQQHFAGTHDQQALEPALPEVALFAVDDRHLVVRITKGDAGLALAEPGLAATLAVLQETDRRLGIEELQGYPRRFWPLVLPGEPATSDSF